MSEADDKRLAAELAHLDRIEVEAREFYGDPQITFIDVVAIRQTAQHYGVTPTMAYRRARELGLLSYQSEDKP